MNATDNAFLWKSLFNFVVQNQWKNVIFITDNDPSFVIRLMSTVFVTTAIISLHEKEAVSSRLRTYFVRGSNNVVIFCDMKRKAELSMLVGHLRTLGRKKTWLFVHESKSNDFQEFLELICAESFLGPSSQVFSLITFGDQMKSQLVKLVHQRRNSTNTVEIDTISGFNVRRSKPTALFPLPLHGYTLRISTFHMPPWTYGHSSNPQVGASGFTIEVLDMLANCLGFRYSYVILPKPSFGNLENGTWTGTVGAVHRKDSDVGLSITLTLDRVKAVDFSAFLNVLQYVVLIRRPTDVSHEWNLLLFAYPFSPFVWLCFGSMCTLVFAVMSFTVKSYHFFIRYRGRRLVEFSIFFLAWNLICVLLQTGSTHLIRLRPSQIVFATFAVFVLLVTKTYLSLLTAHLTLKTEPKQYNNLEEMLDDGKFGITLMPRTSIEEELKNAKSGVLRRAWNKVQNDPTASYLSSSEEGFARAKMKDFVYLTSLQVALTGITTSDCRLEYLKQPFGLTTLHLILEKNSQLTEIISRKIIAMRSSGVLQKLHEKYSPTPDPTVCQKNISMTIPIEQAIGIFVILAIGVLLSVTAHFFENHQTFQNQ